MKESRQPVRAILRQDKQGAVYGAYLRGRIMAAQVIKIAPSATIALVHSTSHLFNCWTKVNRHERRDVFIGIGAFDSIRFINAS